MTKPRFIGVVSVGSDEVGGGELVAEGHQQAGAEAAREAQVDQRAHVGAEREVRLVAGRGEVRGQDFVAVRRHAEAQLRVGHERELAVDDEVVGHRAADLERLVVPPQLGRHGAGGQRVGGAVLPGPEVVPRADDAQGEALLHRDAGVELEAVHRGVRRHRRQVAHGEGRQPRHGEDAAAVGLAVAPLGPLVHARLGRGGRGRGREARLGGDDSGRRHGGVGGRRRNGLQLRRLHLREGGAGGEDDESCEQVRSARMVSSPPSRTATARTPRRCR